MSSRKPRRTAGSRSIADIVRAGKFGQVLNGVPPVDPALDLAALQAGKPLVMRAYRKTDSRSRFGVLVLNGTGPQSIAWHRGILPRYAKKGHPMRTPIEPVGLDWLGEASLAKRTPYMFIVKLRVEGQPWSLRVHLWDLDLLCAALGTDLETLRGTNPAEAIG